MAGQSALKPLSRRTLKPRRLFASADPAPGPDDADEEAVTDIEQDHAPAPSSRAPVTTPSKKPYRPATPPTTVKKNRSTAADESGPAPEPSPMWVEGAAPRPRRVKVSPFDDWQRTKPGVGKRSRDAIDGTVEESLAESGKGKRSRSGNHAVG